MKNLIKFLLAFAFLVFSGVFPVKASSQNSKNDNVFTPEGKSIFQYCIQDPSNSQFDDTKKELWCSFNIGMISGTIDFFDGLGFDPKYLEDHFMEDKDFLKFSLSAFNSFIDNKELNAMTGYEVGKLHDKCIHNKLLKFYVIMGHKNTQYYFDNIYER